MSRTDRLYAKNKFTDVKKNFTRESWNRLGTILKNGKVHPKGGWVLIQETPISNEAANVLKEVTTPDTEIPQTGEAQASSDASAEINPPLNLAGDE